MYVPFHWSQDSAHSLEDLRESDSCSGLPFARQEGSHRAYIKPGIVRPIVIPTYTEVPVAIIRNNLKTAGISRDEYFRLLGEVQ